MKQSIFSILLSSAAILGYGQVIEVDTITYSDDPMIIPFDEDSVVLVDPAISLISMMTEDGMLLRWAPNTTGIWLDGLDYGYTLERKVLTSDTTVIPQYETIGSGPIRPWTEDQWKSIPIEGKPYYVAAAECIQQQSRPVRSGFVNAVNDQQNIFGIQLLSADLDWDAAVASGLGYKDDDVEEDGIYLYRISLANSVLSEYVDTVKIFSTKTIFTADTPKMNSAVGNENSVTLRWEEEGRPSSGYYIERSVDSTQFTRLNDVPYLDIKTSMNFNSDQVVYIDSLEQNYVNYYYRVVGINAFAQESPPSNVVQVMGVDKTPPDVPFNVTSQEVENGIVTLNWDWKDYSEANDIAGFLVLRTTQSNQLYDTLSPKLLAPDEMRFVDNDPHKVKTNKYKIIAIDDKGNSSESLEAFAITSDDVPPPPPDQLSATIDSAGMLLLEWTVPPVEDVRGYLVHFSNSEDGDYTVVAGKYLRESYYIEKLSLNTLSESIYYYVVALDLSYNPSVASEILEVKKPDIIPPAPSIFSDYKVTEEGIYFEWIRSQSDDVASIILERKRGSDMWEAVSVFDQSELSYLDNNVEQGVFYEYRLITIDDAGLESMTAMSLGLEALYSFDIPEVSKLALDYKDEGAEISWAYDEIQNYAFVLYRKADKGQFKTLKIVQGQSAYIDLQVNKKDKYQYGVRVRSADGRESKLTQL